MSGLSNTYRFVCFNILEQYKELNADSDITISQVLYWVQVIGNRLLQQHIKKQPYQFSSAHLNTFPAVPVIVDSSRTPNVKYIEIPALTFDFPADKAIYYIQPERLKTPYTLADKFVVVRPDQVDNLYRSLYTKPSPSNLYRYRSNDKVYLLGIEEVPLSTVEVAMYMALDPFQPSASLDALIPLTPELINQLTYDVLALGRFSLQTPKDRIIDGSDKIPQEVPQKILNQTQQQRQQQPPQEQEQ